MFGVREQIQNYFVVVPLGEVVALAAAGTARQELRSTIPARTMANRCAIRKAAAENPQILHDKEQKIKRLLLVWTRNDVFYNDQNYAY